MLIPNNEKKIDIAKFKELALKGLTCKEIAKEFGIHSHQFGLKIKKLIGIYPSQYIAWNKNGKTQNNYSFTRRTY